jgi:hypothetical protein
LTAAPPVAAAVVPAGQASAGRPQPNAGQEPSGGAEPSAGLELSAPPDGSFSPRVIAVLAGLMAASLAAAALLLAFGGDLGRPPTARPNAWSEGALGHRALCELLVAEGFGVVRRQSRAAMGLGPERPLVLAEPDPDAAGSHPSDAYERDALVHGAAVVLVLPKWRAVDDADHPGWVAAARPWPAAEVVSRVEQVLGAPPVPDLAVRREGAAALGPCRLVPSGDAAPADWSPAVQLAPAQLIVPNDALQPVVDCGDGWLAARRPASAEAPEMLLIADPDLLNNQGLGRADHAALMVRLLAGELHARGVVFDETIHGFRRQNGLLAEALSFPLLPATLHGLLLAGLLVWAANSRLGKPLPATPPPPPGKTVLIDNTAALLALGGHAGDSLARYYRITVRAVADHFFLPPELPPAELRARLEAIARARPEPRAPASPGAPPPALLDGAGGRAAARAVRAAQRLYRWRLGMTDASRPRR